MSEIEKILKANFIEGAIPATFSDETHLADYNMNLYKIMPEVVVGQYDDGKGNELDGKMKATHSSSAFAVNLFGYDKIKIKSNKFGIPEGVYDIRYEEQLKTIRRAPKAHLDVCLYNDECVVYIETKLTEPMTYKYDKNNKKNQQYLESYTTRLRYKYTENYELFKDVFKKIHDSEPKQYDSMQMLKHLLGICNTILEKDSVLKGKKVFLINCHCWNPLIDENENSDFKEFGEDFINLVNEKIAPEYNISLINMHHKEMMEIMEMDEGRRGYVEKRYNLEGLK